MKIPDKVKIGPIVYDVVIEKFNHNSLTEDKLWGHIEHDECKIYVNGNVESQTLDVILFHEVLHGFERTYGLNLKENDVIRISHAIVDFLKENNLLKE